MIEAISGTRRAMKEMADGTIRVQIDIDPRYRAAFHSMFSDIDMPVALAPLRPDFEQPKADMGKTISDQKQGLKGGELARLAGLLCADPSFQAFCIPSMRNQDNAEELAADWVRFMCGVDSRADIDHDMEAAARFHERVRKPFLEWKEARLKGVAYTGEGRA